MTEGLGICFFIVVFQVQRHWFCCCNSFHRTSRYSIKHQQDGFRGKWDNSGKTEHALTCHGQFNWIHQKVIARENEFRKRKIWEALKIKKAKCNKKIKILNRDGGNVVKTNTWTPLLANINKM